MHGASIDGAGSVCPLPRERMSLDAPAIHLTNEPPTHAEAESSFATFWDLARAVNRSDPAALALAHADATDGISIDGSEIRKPLGTMWFRGVVARLSEHWRQRVRGL